MNKNMLSTLIIAGVLAVSGVSASCSDNADIPSMPVTETLPDWEDNVDGSVYDWTATMSPERPYMHDYNNAIVSKLFMGRPDGEGNCIVSLTFEEALDVIKGVDQLSRGVPKIVYLVGWQYEGHDWKYPAFFEFNEALKRPQDANAQESYRWLREEAKKYNTTVSVHVLLNDAEINSPLWHEYVKNDFINLDASGNMIPYAVFNNIQVYSVNIVNEWRKGYLQKRLEKLIELADLDDAKTVHFDAFFGRTSPYHGTTIEDNEVVMRKILRWLRDKNIDVTAEFWHNVQRVDPMYGLQACSWWDDRAAYEQTQVPRDLAGGGRKGRFQEWPAEIFLFGDTYGIEDDFNFVDVDRSKNWGNAWGKAYAGVALHLVPMLYFNSHDMVKYDSNKQTMIYSDGLVADYPNKIVKKGNLILRDHDNTFFPLVQKGGNEIMAYSKSGYGSKRWTLPEDWASLAEVKAYDLNENGLSGERTLSVTDGSVILRMAPNSIILLQKQ